MAPGKKSKKHKKHSKKGLHHEVSREEFPTPSKGTKEELCVSLAISQVEGKVFAIGQAQNMLSQSPSAAQRDEVLGNRGSMKVRLPNPFSAASCPDDTSEEGRRSKKPKKKKKKSSKQHVLNVLVKESPDDNDDVGGDSELSMDVSLPLSMLQGAKAGWKRPKDSSCEVAGGEVDLTTVGDASEEEEEDESHVLVCGGQGGKRLKLSSGDKKWEDEKEEKEEEEDDNISVGREEEEEMVEEMDSGAKEKEKETKFIEPVDLLDSYLSFLRHVHAQLQKRDIGYIFSEPVTDHIAPDYSQIISQPMDLRTMSQKVALQKYSTVKDFRDDFVLMCKNAMTYNQPDTIYHQVAKKYMAVGLNIIIRELTARPDLSRRFGTIPEMQPPPQPELSLKPTNIRINPKGAFVCRYSLKALKRFHAKRVKSLQAVESLSVKIAPEFEQEVAEVVREGPDLTSVHVGVCDDNCDEEWADKDRVEEESKESMEQMIREMMCELEEGGLAVREAAQDVGLCFLNKTRTGYTSMDILNPDAVEAVRQVDLSVLNRQAAEGLAAASQLENDQHKFKEKPITFLMYGPYGSFAPSQSSTFATLSKTDTDLLYSTYGDDLGVSYAHSLQQFVSGTGSFVSEMADLLLNGLTNGRHGKLVSQQQRRAEDDLKKDKDKKSSCEGGLEGDRRERSVSQEGEDSTKGKEARKEFAVDVVKTEGQTGGATEPDHAGSQSGTVEGPAVAARTKVSQNLQLQQTLNDTAKMIISLQQKQTQRLGSVHMGQDGRQVIPVPSKEEQELAQVVRRELEKLSAMVRPEDLVSRETLHKAMGIVLKSTPVPEHDHTSATTPTSAAPAQPANTHAPSVNTPS